MALLFRLSQRSQSKVFQDKDSSTSVIISGPFRKRYYLPASLINRRLQVGEWKEVCLEFKQR